MALLFPSISGSHMRLLIVSSGLSILGDGYHITRDSTDDWTGLKATRCCEQEMIRSFGNSSLCDGALPHKRVCPTVAYGGLGDLPLVWG